ncbi:MAG: DMT family transporter [Geodermatophilaceae bacterium]|nr:DMT family transporter [Geodermatophilaceae bacterium]
MTVNGSATRLKGRPILGPGVGWGALGVVAFSLTFPATRAALPAFGPVTVGLGRAVLAAVLAAACLALTRSRLPTAGQVRRLGLVSIGVVVGFPICSSLALRDATAAHAAVLTGLLPAATAVVAVLRAGERPPRMFWGACALGVVTVVVFAAVQGGGQLRVEDLWLLAAVALGALGYAEGGALARELGGWRVISWALVLSLPVLLPVALAGLVSHPPQSPTAGAWVGLLYVSAISMFAGFYAWYRGLAEGGIAKISQLQLAQPVLTLGWSALLLGEQVDAGTILAGLAVVAAVGLTQRTRRSATPLPSGAISEPT